MSNDLFGHPVAPGGEEGVRLRRLQQQQARYRADKTHDVGRAARGAVARAVKQGVLVRPEWCSHCRKPTANVGRIEAHHTDYSQPLAVVWVCPCCHSLFDRAAREFNENQLLMPFDEDAK